MLAQNFMTPSSLRISEAEHDTLVSVLGMLERAEIPARLFNMKCIGAPECGTPGCILGWARSIGHPLIFPSESRSSGVDNLFFPDGHAPYEASPAQAALALRNYLTTGASCWNEVCPDKINF